MIRPDRSDRMSPERPAATRDRPSRVPAAGQAQRRPDRCRPPRSSPRCRRSATTSRTSSSEPRRVRQLSEAGQATGGRRPGLRRRHLARDLLDALDNLERATEALRSSASEGITAGLDMVQKQMLDTWPSTASSRSPPWGSRSTPTSTTRSCSSPTPSIPRGPSWPSWARATGSATGCFGPARSPSR